MAAEHAPFNAYPRHRRSSIDSKDLDQKNFANVREDDCRTCQNLDACAHEKKSNKTCRTQLFDGDSHHPRKVSWHPEINHKPHKISQTLHVGVEDHALLQERPTKHACTHTEKALHKKIVDDIDVECHEAALMIPPDFICGLSKRVMKDPVVVASGISYEKASIQAWLDGGKTYCPRTGVPLAHLQLVPNLTLKNHISSWLVSHSAPFPLKATCNHTSPSQDSSVSCPNLVASLHDHHQTTSSLPKLLQNLSFSSSFTDSSPPGSPMHLISSIKDKSCCEHEVNLHSRHEANSKISDHKLLSKLVPERPRKEDPMPNTLFKDHVRHKQDDPLRCPLYVIPKISTLVTDIQCGHINRQRQSVTELRILAKHDDNNRTMIANAGALGPLLKLLHSTDKATQQEATTALLNLSLNHTVRDDAVKAGAIEPLVRIVKEGMSAVAKENAAMALANISCNEENQAKVGAAGAIPPLLELLDNGSSRGKKDAATALYSLTSIDENKKRMVRAGGTRLLVSFMWEEGERDGMEEKAIAILRNLVHVEEGRVAFVEEGGIKALLQVMQTGSSKSKNLGISILYQVCSNSTKHRALVLQREPLPLLIDLSESGNFRVKAEIEKVLLVLLESPKM